MPKKCVVNLVIIVSKNKIVEFVDIVAVQGFNVGVF